MNYAGRQPIPFESNEEVNLWLNDRRYKGAHEQDPAYQLHCLARLMQTPDEILEVRTDSQAANYGTVQKMISTQ